MVPAVKSEDGYTDTTGTTTIVPFTMHVLQIMLESSENEVKEIEIWTDEPSSQYRNKYLFVFIGVKLPEIFSHYQNLLELLSNNSQ